MAELTAAQKLYEAVSTMNNELLKESLEEGANVNILVECGMSLVGKAIRRGDEAIIRTLLSADKFQPPDEPADDHSPLAEKSPDSGGVKGKQQLVPLQEPLPGASCSENWKRETVKTGRNNLESDETCSQMGLGLFHNLRKHTVQRRGCDVNMPDFFDRMPIHYAAEVGNTNIVELLIQAGCRCNVSDSNNLTPLHLAVRSQHPKVVELLLQYGCRVNSKTSDKHSALHIACSLGNTRIVEILLRHGANIEVLDGSEQTPLMVAVLRSHCDVVRLLLSHGAKSNVEEIHGYTPLSEAVWNNDSEMVKILLAHGAYINPRHHLLHHAVRNRSYSLTELLIHSGALINRRDETGDAPLHVAIRFADVEIVKLLLQNGSNACLKQASYGATPVHVAVDCLTESNIDIFRQVLELLIEYGADLDTETLTKGDTPLFKSIITEKFKFAEELIRHGCDPNRGNVFSCRTNNLDIAIKKNHLRTVKLLIYSGFPLSRSVEASSCTSDDSSEVYSFLQEVKHNPLSLSKLCRIVVRQCVRDEAVSRVNRLNVPPRLKNFLLFNDEF